MKRTGHDCWAAALCLLLAAPLFFAAGCAAAGTSGRVVLEGERGVVDIAFSDADRFLIRDYYRRHLPPGLAKKNKLPPGLHKHIVRHGYLPPGLEGQRLDRDIESRLAPLPEGYQRLRVGANILLIDASTRLVLDLITDVGY